MTSPFSKPTKQQIDERSREIGCYTDENHPPFPFLAMVNDDPDRLGQFNNLADFTPCLPNATHKGLVYVVFDRKNGLWNGISMFAKPYHGPLSLTHHNLMTLDVRALT